MSGHSTPAQAFKIAPSILSADFAKLAQAVERLNTTACAYIHVDVMDGHFVPNLTFGAPMVKALAVYAKKPLDVHLMITEPERYVDEFIAAGSALISIHLEIAGDVRAMLKRIRQAGVKASLALNPATDIKKALPYMEFLDQVLLMSVNPGFAQQTLMPEVLTKGQKLRRWLNANGHSELDLQIDGGVNADNIAAIAAAGFNVIVAGAYIFQAADMNVPINTLLAAGVSQAKALSSLQVR